MKKTRKIILIGLLVYVLAMIAIYLGVSVFFMKHFYPKSIINGIDCSSKTVEEAEKLIAQKVQNYSITIKEKDGKEETISTGQMNFRYVSNGQVQKLKDSQNPLFWVAAYFNPKSYSMVAKTTYDKEALKAAMEGLSCFNPANVVKPEDAKIIESGEGYVIQKEVEGNEADPEKAFQALCEAVDRGDVSFSLVDVDCYRKPVVYSNDEKLNSRVKSLNQYANMSVTYNMGSEQEVLDSARIKEWMTMDDAGNVTFSEEAIAGFVSTMADKYDTYGRNVSFHTSRGEDVSIENVTYGWQIDGSAEREKLMSELLAGEPVDREPVYAETGWTRDGNGIGDTYVEIDYGSQHMWFYKDGALVVDTDVVTGNPNKGNASPIGIFCLVDKERNATLVGEDYRTPVSYWMPYYNGVGIHDADWQPVFGGDRYLTYGSHGCINTPNTIVSVIYDSIEIGTPIVCYEGSFKSTSTTPETTAPATETDTKKTESEAVESEASEKSEGSEENQGEPETEQIDAPAGGEQE